MRAPSRDGRRGRRFNRPARLSRGDIYRVLPPARRGREARVHRYGVVVQTEALLGCPTAIVAPASASVAPATFRPEVVVAGEVTRVLVEQLCAVDVQRLGERVARLAPEEQRALDEALELVLGL